MAQGKPKSTGGYAAIRGHLMYRVEPRQMAENVRGHWMFEKGAFVYCNCSTF